jgi:hypothetical protein
VPGGLNAGVGVGVMMKLLLNNDEDAELQK